MRKFLLCVGIFFIFGCHDRADYIRFTINEYIAAANKVELGMSKQQVINILNPSQRHLKNTEIKQSEQYIKEGVTVDIFYFRSGLQSDGLTTDDEFTPYIFNDGKLVAIGWATIGGPKSQGQVGPKTTVIVH